MYFEIFRSINFLALLAGSVFASTSYAASGFSDMANTRAVWLREPYTLVEVQGTNAASLCIARKGRPFEVTYQNRIVPLQTIADELTQMDMIGTRFVAVRAGGTYLVVDLDRRATPREYSDLSQVWQAEHLSAAGLRLRGFAEFAGAVERVRSRRRITIVGFCASGIVFGSILLLPLIRWYKRLGQP